MSWFDDDESMTDGFSPQGASVNADDATFQAARASVLAGISAAAPVASPELATLLRESAAGSRMNPLAKIAGLGLAGKVALASGVALAASASGLAVAGVATSGNSHAAAGLAKATTAINATHASASDGPQAGVTDPTDSASPANHGSCVSAVAQTTPAPATSPDAHGQSVAAAAQSDCGKPTTGKPTALPTRARSHASNHPTDKPSSIPSADPAGRPTSPTHPTARPTARPTAPAHP